MKTQNNHQSYSAYYIIPAIICGIATASIVTGSVGFMVLGAILGLLTAGFWLNVIQHDKEA